VLDEWLFKGSFTKVVLGVDTEDRLVEIYNQAILRNLPVVLIEDNGRTEFGGQQTKTCVGIGPLEAESFVGLTHHLKLY
jgi:PTH2 family peptidyl-tRNA hydrolase